MTSPFRKVPEFWSPVTGEMKRIDSYSYDGEYVKVPLQLDRYESAFFVFHPGKVDLDIPIIEKGPFSICPPSIDLSNVSADAPIPCENILEVDGPWEVDFPKKRKGPGKVEFENLISWPEAEDDRIRFFSGIATYVKEINISEQYLANARQIFIDLGHVREVAEVYVNDRSAGITWFKPYRLNITELVKPGVNTIRVEVANTWANRLAGDAKLPEYERISHSNVVRLPNAWAIPMKDIPNAEFGLMESGMMGPVSVIRIN